IEIDLVETQVRADARAGAQRLRIAAAELESKRMLGRIVAQEPRAIAMQHRPGGQHFGIEQRPARQQPMEEPAMPIGPFHHRRNTETPRADLAYVLWSHRAQAVATLASFQSRSSFQCKPTPRTAVAARSSRRWGCLGSRQASRRRTLKCDAGPT